MNLADCSMDELLKIQEVCLVIRDIADYIVLDDVTQQDKSLMKKHGFEVLKFSNSIILKPSSISGDVSYTSRFPFGVNCDPLEDNRPFSSRYQTDMFRYVIRDSDVNNILMVNAKNVFWRDLSGDEYYLEPLSNCDDEIAFQGEVFQRSLVLSSNEMNILILNFLLKDTLRNTQGCLYCGYTDMMHTLLEVHPFIEDIRTVCLPKRK